MQSLWEKVIVFVVLFCSSRKITKEHYLPHDSTFFHSNCIAGFPFLESNPPLFSLKKNSFVFSSLHLNILWVFTLPILLGLQRIGTNQSFPWLLDSFLCIGVILHGVCNSKPEFNSYLFSLFGQSRSEIRLDFIYLVAGYYTYMCSLALAPYKVFYAMATIGAISFALRILQRRTKEKGEPHFGGRKHSHRHWK